MDARKWQVLAKGLSGRGHPLRPSFCLRVQLEHHPSADHVHRKYQGSCKYIIKLAGHGARTTAGTRSALNINGVVLTHLAAFLAAKNHIYRT